MPIFLISIGIIVLVGILWIVGSYNRLVRLRNQLRNAWGQIDVQLKRRHDLIPNLVNTVKGEMKYERETLQKVMEARAKAISAKSVGESAKAEGELSGFLSKLFALVENYPQLKANENVLKLQEELTTTENQISFARQFYNDTTMRYNNAMQMFPGNIIAGMFGFKRAEFFSTSKEEKKVPEVDINI